MPDFDVIKSSAKSQEIRLWQECLEFTNDELYEQNLGAYHSTKAGHSAETAAADHDNTNLHDCSYDQAYSPIFTYRIITNCSFQASPSKRFIHKVEKRSWYN